MSEEADRGAFLSTTRALLGATISTGVCTLPAAVLLVLALGALRRAMLAADKLMDAASPHWSESFMPSVLFAILGLVFGAFLGWRASSAAGGLATWIAAVINVGLLFAVGAVAAIFVFSPAIPRSCWLSLSALCLCALAGVYVTISWFE